MGLKRTIAGVLPEPFKAAVRPLYRAVFERPATDRPSNLTVGTFDGYEVAYRRGTADERQIHQSFSHDIFFARVPEYVPADDHVIVDVGAHIGTFAILAASKVPNGRVHAIEASEDSFHLLKINVALNACRNVTVHRVAVAAKDGPCTLYHARGNWGHSIVHRRSHTSEVVPGVSLTTFLETNALERVHFIKFNVEGAEFPILLNTPGAVLQRFDTVVVLYHCDLCPDHTAPELLRHLEASGFACAVRHQTEKRGWIIATRKVAGAR
jgi:FkbM family methyltransferase